jgi:hypothetical protein
MAQNGFLSNLKKKGTMKAFSLGFDFGFWFVLDFSSVVLAFLID